MTSVVRPKSGPPVKGLQQSDFTILDNDVPQTITSFEAVDGKQARIEVILVFDAVNIGSREAANAYEEIKKFLKSDRGRLAYPTAVAILTGKGLESPLEFSQDGNAISAALGKRPIAARTTTERHSFSDFVSILFADAGRRTREAWTQNHPLGVRRGGRPWLVWRTSTTQSSDNYKKKCSEMSLWSRRSSERARSPSSVWTLPLWGTLAWSP